jgi:hypothetical protein
MHIYLLQQKRGSFQNLEKICPAPTTDRDFFHTIPWLFAEHHGVIVIALKQPNRAAILLKLEWILEKLPPQSFRNRVFQLRDTSCIATPPLS